MTETKQLLERLFNNGLFTIAHDCFIGNNCIFSNNSTLAGQ